jgi:peptide/nickel transport system substrate-binding protein
MLKFEAGRSALLENGPADNDRRAGTEDPPMAGPPAAGVREDFDMSSSCASLPSRTGFSRLRRTALATTAVAAILGGLDAAAAADLRVAIQQDATTLDPIQSSDNPSIWTELLIFDQLVRPSADGTELTPALAEKWAVSADGLEYRFTLRDAKFADGTPVTADDVVFSLKRASGEGSDWARFFKPITRYDVVDAKTVVMHLDKPFTPILNNLALFSASIVPKAQVEAKGAEFFKAPFASGPFSVVSWTHGEKIVLKKNPSYWQAGKPAVDGAEISVIADDNARVLKLKAGEVDAIVGIPFNQVAALKRDPALTVGVAETFRVDLVQLNTTKKPLDDPRVRQALNYAVDKDGLIKGVLHGNGRPAASSLPIMVYHDPALTAYPHDPAKARALLAEAGVEDPKLSLLVAGGDVTARQVATALQSDFKKVGVDLAIQSIEGSTEFATTKAGNYEAALSFATNDTIDPDQLIGFTAVNPERADAYHTRWKSERLNDLYVAERQTLDGPEREKQFREMAAIVHDGAPFVFLFHPGTPYASRRNVEGFKVLATSNYRLEDVVIRP